MTLTQARPGLAYGVFKCADPRPRNELLARFKEALENIKAAHDETKIPPETEFSVHGMIDGKTKMCLDGNSELVIEAEAMERKGANLMIRSSLDGATDMEAARDLGDAFNMLYGGTELFDAENEGRSKMVMEIFYRGEGGRFVSKLDVEPPSR